MLNFKFFALQKRIIRLAFFAIGFIAILNSCTKLDTTVLGSDLVTVDNINTFSQTMDVITTQGVFQNDSTLIYKSDNHIVGRINDPNFGSTDAELYLQVKPPFYPFYFGNAGDTVKGPVVPRVDTVFLCLSFRGTWGDSSAAAIPQTFKVYTIVDPLFKSKTDTLFGLGYRPTAPTEVGSAIVTPKIAAQKKYFGKPSARDSSENQIRIQLTPAFVNYIFNQQDSTTTSGAPNNAYNRDSIFRERFNGFSIKSTNVGNSLFYVNLTDAKTRLEIHYDKKSNTGVLDTVMTPFFFYPTPTLSGNPASSSANYVKRDYSGFPRLNSPSNTPVTDYIDLQTGPGTFANIRIQDLYAYRNLKDKIIHRAYLMVDQYDATPIPSIYTAPANLYLDLKDSILPNKHKPVYFDLSDQLNYNPDVSDLSALFHPFPNSNVDISSFGGNALKRTEGGISFTRYEINLTRYVQHIVSNNFYNYDMRLYAPFNYYYPQYLRQYVIPFYNQLAFGSVRVGAGTSANVPHKMKMIVIYSKVKK